MKLCSFRSLSHLYSMLCIAIVFATLPARQIDAQLAATPPMGWNSWNHFGANVTDKDIRAAADAIASNGMKEAGYIYVNIDDGWQGKRDGSGRLHANESFPDMSDLAAYVHSKGLKLGIYTSPGRTSCAHHEGSMGHVEQDAQTFANWQIDYIKYDICSFRDVLATEAHGDPALSKDLIFHEYAAMSAAIRKTGRPMVLSMSQHGVADVWRWGAEVGAQMWRTGDDVRNNYESVTGIGFAQAGFSPYAGPGHWNDPDMLEIGNGGLNDEEARTQMTLWALLAAPLLAGNDLSHMPPRPSRFSPTLRSSRSTKIAVASRAIERGRKDQLKYGRSPCKTVRR